MAAPDFIPPETRARLKGLRLSARRSSGAFGFGLHSSHQRGAGKEFAQYRAYEPGDEPRQIDWKLYARSDKFFVREAQREAPLTLWIILDSSASMGQSDSAKPAWSRLAAARCLAACAIELALRQDERFGVIGIGDGAVSTLVPAASGARQRDLCLLELHRLKAAGTWPAEAALRSLWERLAPGALVLLLSDFFDNSTVIFAEKLAAAQREVLCIQLLTASERDFPFVGGHRFRDPESGAELITDAGAARADFLQAFAEARRALASRFTAAGIAHTGLVLDEPPDQALRQFFGPRGRRELGAAP